MGHAANTCCSGGWGLTEMVMHTKTLLVLAALAAAPLPAWAASGAAPELSCDMVHSNPSWFSHRAIAECRHAAALEPMGYVASAPTHAVTNNSSCADVRYNPENYSVDIRASCGAATQPYGSGDWGGGLVH
jgi:hypothetical protein